MQQPYTYQYSSNSNPGNNQQPLSKCCLVKPTLSQKHPLTILPTIKGLRADGVGMRHPSSFMNNGMERQYGQQHGNQNTEYQNRGASGPNANMNGGKRR
uniref:Uncharacterized protein n=1 Tax=Ditylenchus dipsaci TaxID=166011 RepID=A0A915DA18_9BILA